MSHDEDIDEPKRSGVHQSSGLKNYTIVTEGDKKRVHSVEGEPGGRYSVFRIESEKFSDRLYAYQQPTRLWAFILYTFSNLP